MVRSTQDSKQLFRNVACFLSSDHTHHMHIQKEFPSPTSADTNLQDELLMGIEDLSNQATVCNWTCIGRGENMTTFSKVIVILKGVIFSTHSAQVTNNHLYSGLEHLMIPYYSEI